jgi:non-ribosomal peptide synthase protein (TIGR01720 family)
VRAAGSNRFADTATVRKTLDPATTARLVEAAHRAYRTTPEDLLLVALARALAALHGRHETLIELEGHGREPVAGDLDLSRTMGWFTSLYPFRLRLPAHRDLGYQIKAVKEDLRRVPARGVGYGILRHLGAADPALAPAGEGPPGLRFNYLGQFQGGTSPGTLAAAPDLAGRPVHPEAPRPSELEVSAMVLGGSCTLELGYSRARMDGPAVEALGATLERELRAVLDHCEGATGTQVTPSDLTYSSLELDELEELFDG